MSVAARRIEARQTIAHMLVACPVCKAPVGERCRRMPLGFRGQKGGHAVIVRHHAERWEAAR